MSAATLTAAEAGCPFCKLVMERVTTGRGIEQIGSSGVYHFEPLNPVTPGHRLFVPAFHYEDAAEAPSSTGAVFEWAAWWAAQQDEDFNLIVNAGPAASQTVRHLHIHYVPRRPSDGLILPWSSLAEKRAEWGAEQGEPEKPSERIHQLIHDLTDPGECWFDHHGGCQEHGYLTLHPGEKCPHAEARELLAEWAVPDTTNETGEDQ